MRWSCCGGICSSCALERAPASRAGSRLLAALGVEGFQDDGFWVYGFWVYEFCDGDFCDDHFYLGEEGSGRHLPLLNSATYLMTLPILILATAYLLGSIPFGYLLVRFFRKEDIRALGSGNIGATNVARSGAKGLGLLTLFLDALKGAVAVYIAIHFAPTVNGAVSNLAIGAAVFAVLGHVFPVWLGFKGGKGIATALGVFIALVPLVALGSFLVFLLVVVVTRLVSLGSILAAVSIPVLGVLLVPAHTPELLAGLSVISLVCIAKHHANIARLMHGQEPKFGTKKVSA
jgi:glycerol-3-phosphate acyltransferase PlsY